MFLLSSTIIHTLQSQLSVVFLLSSTIIHTIQSQHRSSHHTIPNTMASAWTDLIRGWKIKREKCILDAEKQHTEGNDSPVHGDHADPKTIGPDAVTGVEQNCQGVYEFLGCGERAGLRCPAVPGREFIHYGVLRTVASRMPA